MKGFHEETITGQQATRYLSVFYNGARPDARTAAKAVHQHWHEHLELLYLCAGECQLVLERDCLQLAAGDLVILSACSSHEIPDLTGCTFLVIQFSPDLLDGCDGLDSRCLLPFLQPDSQCLARAALQDKHPIINLLQEIYADFQERPLAFELNIKGSLLKIFSWLIREQLIIYPVGQKEQAWLRQLEPLLDYVSLHFAEKVTERQAANICFLSCHHFCRIFRQVTGKNFLLYLQHVRLQEARRLLTASEQKIGVIALETGFSSPSHFTAAFRKTVGLTPAAYRKQFYDRKDHHS